MNLHMKPDLKFIITGGGTGGHIFPAIAIADALKRRLPQAQILFVGAKGRMEMEKVPAAGYQITGLWISGLQRRITTQNLLFPLKVISAYIKARSIIHIYKPDAVIGVGGYASGPTLRAAISMKIPTIIQEQNSYAGLTNKLLAPGVKKICVAYQGMEKYFPAERIVITGNPVRRDITALEAKRAEALSFFGLRADKPILLVIGGSLGARTINESIMNSLSLLFANGLQVIWQTGNAFAEKAAEAVEKNAGQGIRTFSFITRMDMAYAAADMIVSRAGAIAISELCLVGKPAILVPSPNVAADHQTKNAMALAEKNAALLVRDSMAREELGLQIVTLANDALLKQQLSANITQLAFPDAADRIATEIIGCIKPTPRKKI
jgi:UDP-N-acetylglucosamine--N-acetylmuramyl-(pentapeptide) pyrophosphoryl-undecaprenol N-acetylglucosamine transferase